MLAEEMVLNLKYTQVTMQHDSKKNTDKTIAANTSIGKIVHPLSLPPVNILKAWSALAITRKYI